MRNTAEQRLGKSPCVLRKYRLHTSFPHGSTLSRTLSPLFLLHLLFLIIFLVPFAHPASTYSWSESTKPWKMTLSLSSGLLRALPVVLHHPGLPQLHLAFYCTKCCSRLNIIISLFGWGKGRSPLHTDLEDGLPHKPLPTLGCAMRMKLV